MNARLALGTFASTTGVLAIVAMTVGYLPVMRTSRAEPVTAFRDD